jgi:hypothetical protein
MLLLCIPHKNGHNISQFSKLYHHAKIQESVLNGSSVASISEVFTATALVILVTGNKRYEWSGLLCRCLENL